jgi:hypothetical protein
VINFLKKSSLSRNLLTRGTVRKTNDWNFYTAQSGKEERKHAQESEQHAQNSIRTSFTQSIFKVIVTFDYALYKVGSLPRQLFEGKKQTSSMH